MEVNFLGTFAVTQAFAPVLAKNGGGAIANLNSNINAWPEWDRGLESASIDGPTQEGSRFVLKPRGGPNVKMSIEQLRAPNRMVDVAHLPLAKLRTSHEFLPSGRQTIVRFSIEVSGPLGLFWRKVVGEKQLQDAPAQTASFIQHARQSG